MTTVNVLAVLDDLVADMGDATGTTGHQVALVRDAVAELVEAGKAAEFHLTREHRAPTTVDAADYQSEVERDRDRLRTALARVGGAA